MDNYRQKSCEPIGEANLGKVQWYTKPKGKNTMFGRVKSDIDSSEAKFDERDIVNSDRKAPLDKGSVIVYISVKNGKSARSVFNLNCSASDDQIGRYWEMLVKLAERLDDPAYTEAVKFAENNFSSPKERVDHVREYLLKKANSPKIGNVDMGIIRYYNYSRKYNSTFGYVKSKVNGEELKVVPNALVNCDNLNEGDFVIYEDGEKANHVFNLKCSASDDQIGRYWEILVKLAECLNDPAYTEAVQFAEKNFSSQKECVDHVREYLLKKANPLKIGNVDMGVIRYYNYSNMYDSTFGYVKSKINSKELKVVPSTLVNCSGLDEGDFVIYEDGVRANHVFNLKCSASEDQIDRYWAMLVKLGERLNNSEFTQTVQLAEKYFDTVRGCVDFVSEFALVNLLHCSSLKNPYSRLPEDFLVNFPEFFGWADNKQRVYLYENDKELFAECLKKLEPLSSTFMKVILQPPPEDFLVNFPEYFDLASTEQKVYLYKEDIDLFKEKYLKSEFKFTEFGLAKFPEDFLINFPDHFSRATDKQRIYLYENDKELFAECLKNSEALSSTDMETILQPLPEDFLVNFPKFFILATDKQRVYLYENDKELFAECLKNSEALSSTDIKTILQPLSKDFLTDFPDYFVYATSKQLLSFIQKDEQGLLKKIEQLSKSQKEMLVPKMPKDFAEKYPQYAVYASKKQLKYKYESDAQNEKLTPEQQRQITYNWSQVQGIKYLVHFTRIENLKGILSDGLVTRASLENSDKEFLFTDSERLDDVKNSISLSVSFPNYKMFYKKKSDLTNWNNDLWCVLLLKTEILRDIDCVFNIGNAASHLNRGNELNERKSPKKFMEFFEDYGERSKLKKPSNQYATDPQSEILCLGNIPLSYISACCFNFSESYFDDNYRGIKWMMRYKKIQGIFDNEWYFGKGPYENYDSYKKRQANWQAQMMGWDDDY